MTDETKNPEHTIDPVTGEKVVPQLTQEELQARMDNPPLDERKMLREKADMLGIDYSPNIGNDTLRQRINEHLNPKEDTEPAPQVVAEPAVLTTPPPQPVNHRAQTHVSRAPGMPSEEEIHTMTQDQIAALKPEVQKMVIRRRQQKECMRLIRCQIYNNNPAKNELKGEILSVGNKYLGTVRKFIPFGEATENGYHVPKILVDMLKAKRYQRVRSVKNPDGTERVETILAPEFTINELPPLTQEQLKELAAMQTARNASVGFVGA
jgi:hypothetical protein